METERKNNWNTEQIKKKKSPQEELERLEGRHTPELTESNSQESTKLENARP